MLQRRVIISKQVNTSAKGRGSELMSAFKNNPGMKNEAGEWQNKRYTHQPLTLEHFGFHIQIKENGKVLIRGQVSAIPGAEGEMEYDEVEVPASLIFKIKDALNMTRKVEMVTVSPKT